MPSEAPLQGRNVLLCLTGSVAGIKVGELVTRLQAAGATVQVAATEKGGVFQGHSQQALPEGVRCVLQDDDYQPVRPLPHLSCR